MSQHPHNPKVKLRSFTGKSGKHYLENPFGGKERTFAVYGSAEDLTLKNYQGHIPEKEAFLDYKIDEGKITYEIVTPKEKLFVHCSIEGEIIDKPSVMIYEYYQTFIDQFGRLSVSITEYNEF